MSTPLVKIDTATDPVPLIIEHPDHFPFTDHERAEWREATDDEYARYVDHYNAEDVARCSGCGRSFKGAKGLRVHQSARFVAMGCRPTSPTVVREPERSSAPA